MGQPLQKLGLAGVRRKTAKRMDFCPDNELLADDPECFRPIDECPPWRPVCLESHEYHVRLLAPEIVFQVMSNSTPVAHTAAGNNDRTAFDIVQRHGFGRGG